MFLKTSYLNLLTPRKLDRPNALVSSTCLVALQQYFQYAKELSGFTILSSLALYCKTQVQNTTAQ
jgi:hypothetical protein